MGIRGTVDYIHILGVHFPNEMAHFNQNFRGIYFHRKAKTYSLSLSCLAEMKKVFSWPGQSYHLYLPPAISPQFYSKHIELLWFLKRAIWLYASMCFWAKVCLVKAMVFPIVMYGCESWTVKKAERRRIDAFELWCWKRLLRVPWTARRSNQSIQKDISPECSLEWLMLKLKLQYFGHLMRRADLFEKTLMLGKIEGGRRRG